MIASYIINFFLTSALSFLMLTGVAWLLFKVMPLRFCRCRLYFTALCFFKLPLDFLWVDTSKWAIAQGVNPWIASEGTRYLSVGVLNYSGFFAALHLENGLYFTPFDALFLKLPSYWLHGVAAVLAFGSLISLFCRIYSQGKAKKRAEAFIASAKSWNPPIQLPKLRQALLRLRVDILLSSEISSPVAIGGKSAKIVFPKKMSPELTEAIVAHELEHLRFKDGLLRCVIEWICALYWFVPTRFWQRFLATQEEIACDFGARGYGNQPLVLAEAIYSVGVNSTNRDYPMHAFASARSIAVKRVKHLLQFASYRKSWAESLASAVLVVGVFFLITGSRFWPV